MADQMTLGALIAALEREPADSEVYFDFARIVPTTLDSYRGYYNQLALGFSVDGTCTVGQLLAHAREALTKSFEGYKGGTYSMSERTPVWVSNWGRAEDTGIIGVFRDNYYVVLLTGDCDQYRFETVVRP